MKGQGQGQERHGGKRAGGGWGLGNAAPGTIDAALDSALCTLNSVLCLLRGRWSLPGANGIRERVGVSGWRFGDAATGAIDSALDSALCTP
jgi:hypothetical protein